MEVTEQYCGLRTRDNQNNEYQKQEAKHVIHLVRPIEESFQKIIKKIQVDIVLVLFLRTH